jgi:hypothetical protein
MSRTFTSLGVVALAMFVAVGTVLAQAPAGSAKSSTASAVARSVTGTLERYDATGNTIVVNTGKSTETLSLGSDSSIRMGAARMSPSDLTAHAGQKVKVRYTQANGQRMVQTLQIEGGNTHAAQTTKSPAKK